MHLSNLQPDSCPGLASCRHLAFVGDSVMRKIYYTVWQLILSKARRRVLLTPAAPHSKASMSPVHCVLPRQYMRHHLD